VGFGRHLKKNTKRKTLWTKWEERKKGWEKAERNSPEAKRPVGKRRGEGRKKKLTN